MLRVATFSFACLISVGATAPVLAQAASTIRIEPRPYHGAIVTLEQGVRVWRPLPPNRYVIINPDGKTPLNLSLADVRERSVSRNYFYDRSGRRDQPVNRGYNTYGVPAGAFGYGRDFRRFGKRGRYFHPRGGAGFRPYFPGRGVAVGRIGRH